MNVNNYPRLPHAGEVIDRFQRLESELRQQDQKLEENEHYGRVPSRGWNTWFAEKANELQAARDGFALLAPNEGRLIRDLGVEVIDLGIQAGKTEMYQKRDIAFGRGWGDVLDSTVGVVRAAIDALSRGDYNRPPGGDYGRPGEPGNGYPYPGRP